jgi:hypothetical protein
MYACCGAPGTMNKCGFQEEKKSIRGHLMSLKLLHVETGLRHEQD